MKSTISAIILTKNDEKLLAHCLEKLRWTDEQIIVDNGSTDETIAIAKKNSLTIISETDLDFSKLRNLGAKTAKSKWLLYIDTDEEVSEPLRKEIMTRIEENNDEQYSGFVIQRNNYYLGKKWPFVDGMIRLIRKDLLLGWNGKLHETARLKGDIGILHERLIHKTHRLLEEMVYKTNEWSEIESDLRINTNHPPIVPWRLFRVMLTGFYSSFIHQRGWQAGTEGYIESLYQAFSLFITYAKVWEKQQTK